MNMSILAGRVCTVPQLNMARISGKTVCLCRYVIAVRDGEFCASITEGKESKHSKVDFFQCVAFENAASMINDNFVKDSKIVCMGRFRNHKFDDINGTKHFTNIFLVHQAEFGDTETAVKKFSGKGASADRGIVSDLKELESLYSKACEEGFLCLDENDYYRIAMSCM